MAAQSSILAWRIPWTEGPGGLQLMRVAKSQTPLSDSHLHWQGYPLAVVCRLLTVLAVASPIVEHRLQGTWLQQSRLLAPRERAQQLWVHGLSCPTTCGTFPGSQVEPMSPASAGKFFTTEPPGKPLPTLKKKKKDLFILWNSFS